MDDLADLIKLEVERKRKSLALVTSQKPKKYYKRGELEKLTECGTVADTFIKLPEHSPHSNVVAGTDGTTQPSPTIQSSTPAVESADQHAVDKNDQDDDDEDDAFTIYKNIPEKEIRRRFRAKNHPIQLFGESQNKRLSRLKAIEMKESHGNQSLHAVSQVNTQLQLEEVMRGTILPQKEKERIQKRVEFMGKYLPDIPKISPSLLETNRDRCTTLIYVFWKDFLHQWELDLSLRSDAEKRTTQGKLDMALQQQSADYMKPFFKHLRRDTLPDDVMDKVSELCYNVHRREYVAAHDAYLRLSIGNAPWPIGVTAVGIHERSNREKIYSNQVAHVLNDETQRKWIQSIKRLISFAQRKYPPSDLAKVVG